VLARGRTRAPRLCDPSGRAVDGHTLHCLTDAMSHNFASWLVKRWSEASRGSMASSKVDSITSHTEV